MNCNHRSDKTISNLQLLLFTLRCSHVKQCSVNYHISPKSLTPSSNYMFALIESTYAYIVHPEVYNLPL